MQKLNIKANQKIIKQYYEILEGLTLLHTYHETAVRAAFQRVLEDCAKKLNWTLVLEYSVTRQKGKRIVVDGAIINSSNLVHGYWEAKDEKDDLEKEIKIKFEAGYPKENILFQTPSRAVLYQNGKCVFNDSIKNPQNLVDLLKLFFEFIPPAYEQWEVASNEFRTRIPEIGASLLEIIEKERKVNLSFVQAFQRFSEIIRLLINPNISDKAIEEMLIQHILTERIFRKVFQNPDFVKKNTIAIEIEKVVGALTSRGWNRDDFLKQLDRFYIAIEETARTIQDFSELQGFLNKIYENFFRGFSVKIADTHGIVYTPQTVVNFMVHSVQDILKEEFNKTLSEKNIHILDPFVGTGNFIVKIMEELERTSLDYKYSNELHCNEIMLLPYYIASMNIEHKYYELTGEYKPFEGICLVDTFELNEEKQGELFTEKNTERILKQKETPIFVIIGNPPYNSGQQDENDNNKNRKYNKTENSIDNRVSLTYGKDSTATLKSDLGDVYVKSIRWASDRILREGEGIVAFITNNSFLDDKAFDGMRKHLMQDFSKIYIIDLKGNVRRDSMKDGIPIGEKHTVFGLSAMVGICISFFIKKKNSNEFKLFYDSVHFRSTREEKFKYLDSIKNFYDINWSQKEIIPDKNYNWLTEGLHSEYETFLPLGNKTTKAGKSVGETIFQTYSLGVSTNRDNQVYSFSKEKLIEQIQTLIENYSIEVSRVKNYGGKIHDIDSFIKNEKVNWSESLKKKLLRHKLEAFNENYIRVSLYRPFTKKYHYYDTIFNDRPALFKKIFPFSSSEKENLIICCVNVSQLDFIPLAASCIVNLNFGGRPTQCFPLYTYDANGVRKENISDETLKKFIDTYKDEQIQKKDIFGYVYGVLHSPHYRKKYAENLKRAIPKIPFLKDFWGYSQNGWELLKLHAYYEDVEEFPLVKIENRNVPINFRVEKMKISKDKKSIVYNEFLTLSGIPEKALQYKIGNRSALDWIVDQYKIEFNEKGEILSDPNNLENPQYILSLIAKVVSLSINTLEIIESLPEFKLIESYNNS